VDANGVQYAAGMGLGVQNTLVACSHRLFSLLTASRYVSGWSAVTLPFVIQNGQTFINDAFFQDASIQLKITDSLKSDNFVSGLVAPGGICQKVAMLNSTMSRYAGLFMRRGIYRENNRDQRDV
jgi:hypothetical protein